MAQDLKKISPEMFQLEVFKLNFSQLKSIEKDLQNILIDYSKVMSHAEQKDILRKMAIILREMQRKGYYKKQDHKEYNEHFKKNNYKKRKW